jgi:hypothetical protein
VENAEVLHGKNLKNLLNPESSLDISTSAPPNTTMTKDLGDSSFRERRRSNYPAGLFVRVRMVSGREIDAQITKIETTTLGTFFHVEFGEEVANVTARQLVGYYDFCPLKVR